MMQALRELEAIVAMDASSGKRLAWLDVWKAKWVSTLSSVRAVDELELMCQDAAGRQRMMDYLEKKVAYDVGELLVKEPELSSIRLTRTDSEGREVPDVVPMSDPDHPYMGRITRRVTRTFVILRREPR